MENKSFSLETVNISENGVRITTDRPLLEGASITVELHLQKNPSLETFTAPGVVIWCQEGLDVGFDAGIAFSLPANTARHLQSYLKTLKAPS